MPFQAAYGIFRRDLSSACGGLSAHHHLATVNSRLSMISPEPTHLML